MPDRPAIDSPASPRTECASATIALALLATTGIEPIALADEPPQRHFELAYERQVGAERCMDVPSFTDAVAARLGYDPFTDRGTLSLSRVEVVIRAEAKAKGKGLPQPTALFATLRMLDEEGHVQGAREFRSQSLDCLELGQSVSLAVSIAIDPVRSMAPPSPPDRTSSAQAPASSSEAEEELDNTERAPPPAIAPSAPTTPPWRWGGEAGALVSFASAPAPAFGIRAQIDARYRSFSIGLEGRADFSSSAAVLDTSRVSASLLKGALVPCFRPRWALVCGLVEAGVLRGRGDAIAHPESDATPHVSMGVRAGAEFPLGSRAHIAVHGDVVANLTRTSLKIGDVVAWTSSPISGALGAAFGGHFE